MPEEPMVSVRAAIVSGLVPLLGAVVGAGAVLGAQLMQGQREVNATCQAGVTKQEEILRQKAEAYLVAVSEQIAFFQQNKKFEVRKAQEKLAEVHKAAFALSAYAGQDLSLKSIAAVAAIESALVPSATSDLQASLAHLTGVVSEWHPSFRAELQLLQERRAECKRAT